MLADPSCDFYSNAALNSSQVSDLIFCPFCTAELQAKFTSEGGQPSSTITFHSAQALLLCLYIIVSSQVQLHKAIQAAAAKKRPGICGKPLKQGWEAEAKGNLGQIRVALGRHSRLHSTAPLSLTALDVTSTQSIGAVSTAKALAGIHQDRDRRVWVSSHDIKNYIVYRSDMTSVDGHIC